MGGLGRQDIERTVLGGELVQLARQDSAEGFHGLTQRAGSLGVIRLLSSMGHVFEGEVRTFRPGGDSEIRRQEVGVSIELPA